MKHKLKIPTKKNNKKKREKKHFKNQKTAITKKTSN